MLNALKKSSDFQSLTFMRLWECQRISLLKLKRSFDEPIVKNSGFIEVYSEVKSVLEKLKQEKMV